MLRNEEAYRTAALVLDRTFYATQTDAPEAAADPVAHYLTAGWREGADPAPWFSTRRYLADYPDVRAAGANPLHHFAAFGLAEGRLAAPAGASDDALATLSERSLAAAAFDVGFYLAANPDVARRGLDPLDHFLTCGWREGREPSRDFCVVDYLDANPDVRAAGINPLVHYLLAGRDQGRSPRLPLAFRDRARRRLVPMSERIARASAGRVRGSDPLRLHARLADLARPRLHVTFSHDDYTRTLGGLQLCIAREVAAMRRLGFDSLHLHPARPVPVVRMPQEAMALAVLLNGRPAGRYPATEIAAALEAQCAGTAASVAVHSLIGHASSEVAALISGLDARDLTYWVHDFSSLCAGFHLMRDDVEACGAPDSSACGECLYRPRRLLQLHAHRRLFARFPFRVAAPSEPALALWRRGGHPAADEVVHAHVRLTDAGEDPRPRPGGPIRVAFVGSQTLHKGWPVFLALAQGFADDPRYRFCTFGAAQSPWFDGAHHAVRVTPRRPAAMAEALALHEVDLVVLWSLCEETFSLAAMEALAAGAAPVTGPDSGNIAAIVRASGRGVVLADEAALEAWFQGNGPAELARRATCAPRGLAFSALTADLFDRRAFGF